MSRTLDCLSYVDMNYDACDKNVLDCAICMFMLSIITQEYDGIRTAFDLDYVQSREDSVDDRSQ